MSYLTIQCAALEFRCQIIQKMAIFCENRSKREIEPFFMPRKVKKGQTVYCVGKRGDSIMRIKVKDSQSQNGLQRIEQVWIMVGFYYGD